MRFDALLLLSFGGPDGPDDVLPFLENVVRGRPVPPARLQEVAAHYHLFGGRSPINDENRALLASLQAELAGHGDDRPVYWGNRNWRPYLTETVARMRDDGVRRAAVLVTSAYSSYSSCRQYLEDMERAQAEVGEGAPELVKLRPYFNHPGFIEPLAAGLADVLAQVGPSDPVLMSAHSIPLTMSERCDYARQLREAAGLVAGAAGVAPHRWRLVYQSRSGPPGQPWLGPDILEVISELPEGTPSVMVCPVGFVSDHMEVVYDLDTEAAALAAAGGIRLLRSPTPGRHPRFARMVWELLAEMEDPDRHPPLALGSCGPVPCPCPAGCPPPARQPFSTTPGPEDEASRLRP